MQVDLPAFERPTKAISGVSIAGRWCSCAAVVKKRAVCIQPMGVTAAGVFGVAKAAAGVALGALAGLAGTRTWGRELINQGYLGSSGN